MTAALAELRFALQRLLRAPAFAIAAIAMLALGFGLTVTMVCAVDGVLLRGLPFQHGERLVSVYADNPSQQVRRAQLSVAEAEQLAHGTAAFESLGYFQWSGLGVLENGHPREIPMQLVGPGYFETLGMAPVLGRVPNADDIRAGLPLAVISYDEWQNAFGGSASVIGRRIDTLENAPLEVVGVMPATMRAFAGSTGVWTALLPSELPRDGARRLDLRILQMVGRLREGATLEQANDALAAQLAALDEAHGRGTQGWRLRSRGLLDLIVGPVRDMLWGALALALMVLIIGCANVALLVDARQVARRREMAVMQAIGASRARLRRGTLFELLCLGTIALLLGLGIAQLGLSGLRDLAEGSLPRVDGIALDWRVVAIAFVTGTVLPLVAALAGALRMDADPAQAMRAGGKGLVGDGGRQRLLPAAAMALSTVCLLAALGLGIGLFRLQRVDPGFRTDGIHALAMFRESLNTDSGADGPPQWIRFGDDVLQRLAASPGARGAALTSAAPLSQLGGASADVRAAGANDDAPVQAAVRRVSAGYNALLDIPLVAGRDFDANDRAGAEPVAIVNRTLARRLFGDASPLGRVVDLPLARSGRTSCRIVGVVDDIRNDGLRSPAAPEVLVPFAQAPRVAMTFLLRTDPGLDGVDAAMSAALWSADPRQTVTSQYALEDRLADELRPARFFARVVAGFAFAALVLAVLGVYAVATLQQRRRVGEFGLRLAVGATPSRLARSILGDSLRVSAVGVGAGCAIAAFLLRAFDPSRLTGGEPALPAIFACGIAVMTAAALLAAALPALRVLRVTPLEALRDE